MIPNKHKRLTATLPEIPFHFPRKPIPKTQKNSGNALSAISKSFLIFRKRQYHTRGQS